jgi:hypothetical protein
MASQRPTKLLRLNYWQMTPEFAACIAILGDPAEIRIQASQKSFISVKEDAITLSGGFPSVINVQGMSSSFKFGGMLQDLPFPMTMIPSTTFTPIPRQMFSPPFMPIIPQLAQLGMIASALVA